MIQELARPSSYSDVRIIWDLNFMRIDWEDSMTGYRNANRNVRYESREVVYSFYDGLLGHAEGRRKGTASCKPSSGPLQSSHFLCS